MKKAILIILCSVLISLLFVSCSAKSPIGEATNATALQAGEIEKYLSAIDISCSEISVSSNPSTNDLGADWKAYDIIGTDDRVYMLILRKADNAVVAIFDDQMSILLGSIDNVIWQSQFNEIQKKQIIVSEEQIQYDNSVTVTDTITKTHRIIVTVDGIDTSTYSENFSLGVASLSVNGKITEVYDMYKLRKEMFATDKAIWIVIVSAFLVLAAFIIIYRKRLEVTCSKIGKE